MKNIAKALVAAQSEMVTPKKGNVNPFFKNKYADINSILEAVMPAFHNNGISILQPTVHIDGKNFVKTILLHESGESLESFTEIIYNKINDAQAQGSGITYARRYGLQSFVNAGADDDDGQRAVQVKPNATKEIIDKAVIAKATIEQIRSKYSVSSEMEKYFKSSEPVAATQQVNK